MAKTKDRSRSRSSRKGASKPRPKKRVMRGKHPTQGEILGMTTVVADEVFREIQRDAGAWCYLEDGHDGAHVGVPRVASPAPTEQLFLGPRRRP